MYRFKELIQAPNPSQKFLQDPSPLSTEEVQAFYDYLLENKELCKFLDCKAMALCRNMGAAHKERLPALELCTLSKPYPTNKILDLIATECKELGQEVFLIGGSVRDFLLGTASLDIDCCMETDPYLFVEHLCQKYGGSSESYSAFGSIHWNAPSGEVIDLTQTRTEVYPQKAHLPKVSPAALATDLLRRDFTINAMALPLHTERKDTLLDPFQGQSDLRQKILRTLHPLSFWDDPTRIFRGARYAGRYDLQCSKMTAEAIQFALQDCKLGTDISWQRIGNELERIFQEKDPISAWHFLEKWKLLEHWFPSWQEALPYLIQVQETTELDQIDRQEAFWAILSIFTAKEERKTREALVSQKPKLRRQWREAPLLQKQLLEDTERFEDHGLFGEFIDKLLPNQTFVLALFFPQLYSQFIWWTQEGQLITCKIRGQDLLAKGCPQGLLIGKALSEAKRTAWRGGSPEKQMLSAQKVWLEVSTGKR